MMHAEVSMMHAEEIAMHAEETTMHAQGEEFFEDSCNDCGLGGRVFLGGF